MRIPDQMENLSEELLTILANSDDEEVAAEARTELARRPQTVPVNPPAQKWLFRLKGPVMTFAAHVLAPTSEEATDILIREISRHTGPGDIIGFRTYDPRVATMDLRMDLPEISKHGFVGFEIKLVPGE